MTVEPSALTSAWSKLPATPARSTIVADPPPVARRSGHGPSARGAAVTVGAGEVGACGVGSVATEPGEGGFDAEDPWPPHAANRRSPPTARRRRSPRRP